MVKITMTHEQKLLKLLQVAVENGWVNNFSNRLDLCTIHSNTCLVEDFGIIDEGSLYYSINCLVTNWEEGQVSFIEALYQASSKLDSFESWRYSFYQYHDEELSQMDCIVVQWVKLPTSQRLDWLFETFKHLLS